MLIHPLAERLRAVGLAAMAQVDLGTRQNRHQTLANLSRMSSVVLRTVAARESMPQRVEGNLDGTATGLWEQPDTYLHAVATEEGLRLAHRQKHLLKGNALFGVVRFLACQPVHMHPGPIALAVIVPADPQQQ